MPPAPVARRLSSARFRRRLAWATGAAVLAGGVGLVVVLLPGQGEPPPAHPTSNAPADVYHPARQVHYRAQERRAANTVLLEFVQSAVIRRHLAASYDLVTPALRQGFTRHAWASGAIPIVPFPPGTVMRGAVLVRSVQGELDYKLSLFPPKGTGMSPALYDLTLKQLRGHWRVDSWAPSFRGLYSPTSAAAPPDPKAPVLVPTNPHLSKGWAYVPVALIAVALLLGPLVLGARWLLDRRQARAH